MKKREIVPIKIYILLYKLKKLCITTRIAPRKNNLDNVKHPKRNAVEASKFHLLKKNMVKQNNMKAANVVGSSEKEIIRLILNPRNASDAGERRPPSMKNQLFHQIQLN